jgi:hypothetical protein
MIIKSFNYIYGHSWLSRGIYFARSELVLGKKKKALYACLDSKHEEA